MKLVPARFGDEVNLRAAGAATLRTAAVAQGLQFVNSVYPGIDENAWCEPSPLWLAPFTRH